MCFSLDKSIFLLFQVRKNSVLKMTTKENIICKLFFRVAGRFQRVERSELYCKVPCKDLILSQNSCPESRDVHLEKKYINSIFSVGNTGKIIS